jgi:tRNA nucleotidyltransferase/poly(A) polymerase
MNFVQIEEVPEKVNVNKNPIKKFNSERLKKKNKSSSCDSNSSKKRKHKNKHTSIKKKESLFNRKRNTCSNIEYRNNNNSNNNNEKIKILTEFFDSIKILYRYGKITSEQKINIKQILISKPMLIIEKFFKSYNNININYDKALLIEKIKNFLMDEINCLY